MDTFDIRFLYKDDNPFINGDINKKQRLKSLIQSRASEFREINYLNESHFIEACNENYKTLFDQRLQGINVGTNPMMRYVKRYILSVDGISSALKAWCGQPVATPPVVTPVVEPVNVEPPAVNNEDVNEEVNTVPFTPLVEPIQRFAHQTPSKMVYDFTSSTLLTYDDVRRSALTLARQSILETAGSISPAVQALEDERRSKLMREINRYQKVNAIRAIMNTDVSKLNIEQLQAYLKQCEEQHEQKKISDTLLAVSNIGGTIYDAVFPDGIPITKTKKISTDGAMQEVISMFTDPTTSIGLSFSNILRKHGVKINDEVVCVASAVSIMAKHIKIEDRANVPVENEEGLPSEDNPYVGEMEDVDSD